MDAMDIVSAPFSDEQVEALNAFQKLGYFHPFDCKHDHGESNRTLIAAAEGWHCPHPGCTYTQDWAYAFMTDKGQHPPRPVFGKKSGA